MLLLFLIHCFFSFCNFILQGPTENHMYMKWAPCWKIFIIIIIIIIITIIIIVVVIIVIVIIVIVVIVIVIVIVVVVVVIVSYYYYYYYYYYYCATDEQMVLGWKNVVLVSTWFQINVPFANSSGLSLKLNLSDFFTQLLVWTVCHYHIMFQPRCMERARLNDSDVKDSQA